jgi:hypothetical protein
MQKNIFRKAAVVVIIALFIGASILPNISGNFESDDSKKYTIFENMISQEDQNRVTLFSADSPSLDSNIKAVDALSVQKRDVLEDFASVPLFFTKNRGQFPSEVLFQTQASGATVYLCRDKIVSVFPRVRNY